MKHRFILAMAVLCASLLPIASCSDKSSNEACLHETTSNLDKGNYAAVAQSPCADHLQKGAAYFGLAGFNTTDVINKFIDANGTNSGGNSDLEIYLTSTIGVVTDTSLSNLDSSHKEYTSVAATDPEYKNAQFSLSLVDAIYALSVIKTIVVTGTSSTLINTGCDQNSNGKPDEIDSASCALYISANQNCASLNASGSVSVTQDVPGLTFAGKTGTYRGLVITVGGAGPQSTCPAPNSYQKLLYQSGSNWFAVTQTAGPCTALNNGGAWPCPVEQNGAPLDLVQAIDTSLDSSISALNTSISSTASNDVKQSIQDIKIQACPSGTCTSSDVAAYLQQY